MAMFLVFLWLLLVGAAICTPPCDNDIYCHGPILKTVQLASLYSDSKTFVDMTIKTSPGEVKDSFAKMMNETNNNPGKKRIQTFVDDNFSKPGSELNQWTPPDWAEAPKFLNDISDPNLREWATELHNIWKNLGREMKTHVKDNPDLYSIIYVPHPVIVPGGRFREFYYWDSYWVIRGLLLSEMHETAKGMLMNFAHIVETIGHIPNGGRIYYKMRSQPPLFIPMVESYLQATNDYDFLHKYIDILEKEFQFWMNNRTLTVEKDGQFYKLAKYNDFSNGPRPESYREDYNLGEQFDGNEEDKTNFFSQLKAACETGWDFSTRWFISTDPNVKGTLTDIQTKSIVPVDLNAILQWNAVLLSGYFKMLGQPEKAEEYADIADKWQNAITKVLWHEEVGSWLDYDMRNQVKRDYFYPSNLAPLWTNSYEPELKDYYVKHVLKYLRITGALDKAGGIPTTLVHSGEQWDYPNGWPPLQHIMITGLDNTGNKKAKEVAYDLAKKWVRSNFAKYNSSHAMYEKYDVSVFGGAGGGGEYEVQLGFGWTNGIIIDLLNKYGHRLTLADDVAKGSANSAILSSAHIAPLLTLILAQTTLIAGCIGAILYARKILPRPSKNIYTRIFD